MVYGLPFPLDVAYLLVNVAFLVALLYYRDDYRAYAEAKERERKAKRK